MTRFLLDVASYQGDLKPSDVQRAGFTAVNLKISHGLTGKTVHPDLVGWVDECRRLGLGISTFHYLTSDATGEAQAAYAYRVLHTLGLLAGTAHQVDVEATPVPPLSSVRSYLTTMAALLQRPVTLYTGDWWWTARDRWDVSDLTPYLWAAPNAGYLETYPGDTSPHWVAGYGGWPTLSVMQYAVAPLIYPDGTRGTIDVSKSAIRDENVWRALTGGEVVADWVNIPASMSLLDEFNAVGPDRSKESDGTIGNDLHAQGVSDHNPDETGNTGGVEDADAINEVHARDVTQKGPWVGDWTMEKFVQIILARCRSGAEKRLRYIIFNRRIWRLSNGWVQEEYDGTNPHDKHAHFSFRYGSGSGTGNPENITTPWGLLAAVEDDMPLTDADADKILGRDVIGNPYGDSATNPTITVKTALKGAAQADVRVAALAATLAANATAEARRDAEQSAQLGQLITLVQTLVSAGDALTDQQFAELKSAMADAAAQAGNSAAERVEGKLDHLREHLGDVGPVA